MPLRLMEIIVPESKSREVEQLIDNDAVIDVWREKNAADQLLVKLLLSAADTEEILDWLEERCSNADGFRVVLLPIEATIPRVDEAALTARSEEEKAPAAEEELIKQRSRISREELYSDVVDSTKLTRIYIALVTLSSIVAAVGLLRDNVAVVIGAMVIAPLLGPNVGLALATTLGDFNLGRRAFKTSLYGTGIGLSISTLIGFLFTVDPTVSEISSRTSVGFSDIALALASGSAGVLAFTSGAGTALIGVMVAVALLPPLVAVGLLLGSGQFSLAMGALLLLMTNLICVNLAGVTTFLAQGIRPRQWWEANKAKKASRWAIVLWLTLLLILAGIIVYLQQGQLLAFTK